MMVFSATHRPHTSPCLWVACCGHLVVLPPTGPRYHRATLCCLAQLSWGSCHAASLPCSIHPLLVHSSGSFEERTTFVIWAHLKQRPKCDPAQNCPYEKQLHPVMTLPASLCFLFHCWHLEPFPMHRALALAASHCWCLQVLF